MKPLLLTALLLASGLPSVASPRPARTSAPLKKLQVHLPFAPGTWMPASLTCAGADQSPAISWSAAPCTSYAVACTDPDAPGGSFAHWTLYNVPASTTALPASLPKVDTLPLGTQGRNDFGNLGYGGPCPPPGPPHHYHFTVYALDCMLPLAAGATPAQVHSALQGHVVAQGEVMGLFGRR